MHKPCFVTFPFCIYLNPGNKQLDSDLAIDHGLGSEYNL